MAAAGARGSQPDHGFNGFTANWHLSVCYLRLRWLYYKNTGQTVDRVGRAKSRTLYCGLTADLAFAPHVRWLRLVASADRLKRLRSAPFGSVYDPLCSSVVDTHTFRGVTRGERRVTTLPIRGEWDYLFLSFADG